MILICTKCGKPIDNGNINVTKDVAFCAPCGEVYKVSILAGYLAAQNAGQSEQEPRDNYQASSTQSAQYARPQEGPKKSAWQHFSTAFFEKYFDFTGRARRAEYWYFYLFHCIFVLAATLLGELLSIKYYYGYGGSINILDTIVSLALFIPYLAVSVRRAHDTGRSGWYILIPIYGFIIMFFDSERGGNQYGPNPKEWAPEQEEEKKARTDFTNGAEETKICTSCKCINPVDVHKCFRCGCGSFF